MTVLHKFLINLDRAPSRLAMMQAQADALGLSFERVSAVDGSEVLPTWASQQFCDDQGRFLAGLSGGEVGCYASHLKVLMLIVERNLEAAIVLEDDAILKEDFDLAAVAAVRTAPEGWDSIHLSTNFKRTAFPIARTSAGRSLVRYSRMPSNSAAYIISSNGAAKLLTHRPRVRPIDLEFRYAWHSGLEIYGVYPPLAAQQEGIPSTIQARWQTDPTRPRRRTIEQIQWKPTLASRIYGWFYIRKRLGLIGSAHCFVANSIKNAFRTESVFPRLMR